MSATAEKVPRFTVEEYLEMERAATERHQFIDGEVFAMSGASIAHNIIAGNLLRRIGNQLEGRPCYSFNSDMKVRIDLADTFAYPDASALCAEPETFDSHKDIITNPSFIAEVLSPSTEAYDRGDKFAAYRAIPSFQEFLLLAQSRMHAELHRRQPDNDWLMTDYTDPDSILTLDSISCTLRLGDLYDKVTFEL